MLLGDSEPHRLGEGAQFVALTGRIRRVIKGQIRCVAAPDKFRFFRLGGVRQVGNLDETDRLSGLGGFQPSLAPYPIEIIGFMGLPRKALAFSHVYHRFLHPSNNPSIFVGNILRFLSHLQQLFSFTFDYQDV